MSSQKKNNMSQLQIVEIKEAFATIDNDGDGCITNSDLAGVMKSLGFNPGEEELKKMIAEIDTDGNGIIDFEEFLEMVVRQIGHRDPEQQLKDTFRLLDEDGVGEISVEKMKYTLASMDPSLTSEDIDQMILEVDSDGNGVVDYEEFKQMMSGV